MIAAGREGQDGSTSFIPAPCREGEGREYEKTSQRACCGGKSSSCVLDETGRSTVPTETWSPRTGAWDLAAVTRVTLGESLDSSDASPAKCR